ncbi:MAG TPA: lipid-binding SYLF domain-containing protein [Bryobacteraceae bacterium]|jgi:lipid-binding SYLF domain-containing protein|nr:lipid-binding SYLF domain-containing protein [Bryobacteraceae bacterium]
MKHFGNLLLVSALGVLCVFGAGDPEKRVRVSGEVLNEILDARDKGIPEDLLGKSQCVGVIPNLKRAGFIVGAKYGKGVVVCRTGTGWSAPSTVIVEGGSIGFQIGAGETDLVFVVMNHRGMDHIMSDKFTVGGDASAMAGPVGRSTTAETDAMLNAEILSWSRSRGIFAGVSLEGATLRPDHKDNREMYGRDVTQREILTGAVRRPAGAEALYADLDRFPKHTASR